MHKAACTQEKVASAKIKTLRAHTISTLLCAIATLTPATHAEPWVNTGDDRTRHHLQILSDTQKLTVPLTSWPVMWSGIKQGLDAVKIEQLNDSELWSYRYLQHALEKAMRSNASITLHANSHSAAGLTRFTDTAKDGSYASFTGNFTSSHFAGQLKTNYSADPDNTDPIRSNPRYYDGTYLATTVGNWALGVGAIERWWGPGWQASMILGNNARPAPSLFVHRKDTSSTNAHTAWLPNWDLNVFVSELQDDRYRKGAKLNGARFTVKPFTFLEIGVSTTQMSGGDNPTLIDSTLDADSAALDTAPNATLGTQEKRKKHYALDSIDWRLGHAMGATQLALYHQIAQTHDSNQTLQAALYGVEVSALIANVSSRISAEYHTTENDGHSIYDNEDYNSGYRHYKKSIATPIDSASSATTLQGHHFFDFGHQFNWRLGSSQLNTDNIALDPPAGHPYGKNTIDLQHLEFIYKLPLSNQLQLDIGLQHYSESLYFSGKEISTGGHLQIHFEF